MLRVHSSLFFSLVVDRPIDLLGLGHGVFEVPMLLLSVYFCSVSGGIGAALVSVFRLHVLAFPHGVSPVGGGGALFFMFSSARLLWRSCGSFAGPLFLAVFWVLPLVLALVGPFSWGPPGLSSGTFR